MFRHYCHNRFWKEKTFRLFSGCLLFVGCFSSKHWITISDPDHQLFCCALAISATINSISTFYIQSHCKNTLKLFRASHSVEGLTLETLDLESLCGGHYKLWIRFIKSNDTVTIVWCILGNSRCQGSMSLKCISKCSVISDRNSDRKG